MYPTKFGEQPVRAVMRSRVPRWTVTDLARMLPPTVSWSHLRFAIDGRTPPSQTLRDELPAILGVPLSRLFSPAALAATYHPEAGRSREDNGRGRSDSATAACANAVPRRNDRLAAPAARRSM